MPENNVQVKMLLLSRKAGSAFFYLYEKLQTLMHGIGAALLFLMTVLITLNVCGRYLFSTPLPATLEVSEQSMALIVFLGLAYAQIRGAHIRVQIFVDRLPAKLQVIANIVCSLAGGAFFFILAWQTGLHAMTSWKVKEAAWAEFSVPIYPTKFAVSLGSFLIVIEFLRNIIQQFRQLRAMS